jgi:hypothetical protein
MVQKQWKCFATFLYQKTAPGDICQGQPFIDRKLNLHSSFLALSPIPIGLTPSLCALYAESGVGQYFQTLRVNFLLAPFTQPIGALPDLLQRFLNGFDLAFHALSQSEVELPVIDSWVPFSYGVIGLILQQLI